MMHIVCPFSDTVGRISVGSSESPSWISMARQKQRNFIENSPENSPEKLPSQVCAVASYNEQICHVKSCPVLKEVFENCVLAES